MRKLILFVLPLFALYLSPGSALTAEPDLTGVWNGTYHYPMATEREPVQFTLFLAQDGAKISGLITEPNSFAEGADDDSPRLHATVKGTYDADSREINFVKSYDGTAQTDHDVEYSGQLSQPGNKVNGKWEISADFGGRFTLEKKKNTRSGKLSGTWAGAYEYPRESGMEPVKFMAIIVHDGGGIVGLIKEPNTFGEGDNPWLYGSVKGDFDSDTRELSFVKTYDGTANQDHEVQYGGRASKDGSAVLNGKWEIPGSWGGRFSLDKTAGMH